MNIITATPEQLTNYFETFFKEKDLDKSAFEVEHSFYGKSNMPFEILVEALTNPNQSRTFMIEVAKIVHKLEFVNASKEKFRNFFSDVAQKLTESN